MPPNTIIQHNIRTKRTYRVCILRFWVSVRAYIGETAFLPLFARSVRFYLREPYVVPSWRNTRLKRLFEERGAAAKISRRRVCNLCKRERKMPWRLVAWCLVGWFAAKYTLNVCTRRGRSLLFMPFARFVSCLLCCFPFFCAFSAFRFFVFRLCVASFFVLCLCAFVFGSCFLFLWHSSFLSFVLLFPFCFVISFSFSFSFVRCFLLCLSMLSYSWYYLITIINNKYILYYFICVCVCARTRTRTCDDHGKTRHKKRAAKIAALKCYPKIQSNIKASPIFVPDVNAVWRVSAAFFSIIYFRGRNTCSDVG